MSSYPMFDPMIGEAKSSLIAGLTTAVSKISSVLNLRTDTFEDLEMTEVFSDQKNKNRLYQISLDKKGWVASPTPIIKKNGVVITSDIVVNLLGGEVEFTDEETRPTEADVITASATYIIDSSELLELISSELTSIGLKVEKYKGVYATLDDVKAKITNPLNGDYAIVVSINETSLYAYNTAKADWFVLGDVNVIESISVDGVTQTITDKNVDLKISDSYVRKEDGKSLVSDTEIQKLATVSENAQANVIESISVGGVTQTITDKNVDLKTSKKSTFERYMDGSFMKGVGATMGVQMFEESGTFHPTDWGLKEGDIVDLILVPGSGGYTTSFGSYMSANSLSLSQGGYTLDGVVGGTDGLSGTSAISSATKNAGVKDLVRKEFIASPSGYGCSESPQNFGTNPKIGSVKLTATSSIYVTVEYNGLCLVFW